MAVILLIATGALCPAETVGAIPIWPNQPPGEKGDIGPEKDTTTPKEGLVAGKPLLRLGNVSTPTITVYRPAAEKNTGAAVLVFLGGGYTILAYDLEGTEVCEWLNSIGVTGIVVKYRVPRRKGLPQYVPALQDAQRAMAIVRAHAKEWGIDPARIGVLGFSAGGHLAAAISNNYKTRTYDPVDETDQISCRPDFAVLIYPAYLVRTEEGNQIAPELAITSETPPTFLVQTEDDGVHVENSLFYYEALKQAKVPAELHLYATGGHGYGLRRTDKAVTTWPLRAEEWFRSQGIVK